MYLIESVSDGCLDPGLHVVEDTQRVRQNLLKHALERRIELAYLSSLVD
jgi:hypothetical protein